VNRETLFPEPVATR